MKVLIVGKPGRDMSIGCCEITFTNSACDLKSCKKDNDKCTDNCTFINDIDLFDKVLIHLSNKECIQAIKYYLNKKLIDKVIGITAGASEGNNDLKQVLIQQNATIPIIRGFDFQNMNWRGIKETNYTALQFKETLESKPCEYLSSFAILCQGYFAANYRDEKCAKMIALDVNALNNELKCRLDRNKDKVKELDWWRGIFEIPIETFEKVLKEEFTGGIPVHVDELLRRICLHIDCLRLEKNTLNNIEQNMKKEFSKDIPYMFEDLWERICRHINGLMIDDKYYEMIENKLKEEFSGNIPDKVDKLLQRIFMTIDSLQIDHDPSKIEPTIVIDAYDQIKKKLGGA